MKEKIIILIIGILVGAVISTGAFYIYTNNSDNKCTENNQSNNGTPPSMPNGQNGQPPEMPSGENGQPPARPGENNTQNNNG